MKTLTRRLLALFAVGGMLGWIPTPLTAVSQAFEAEIEVFNLTDVSLSKQSVFSVAPVPYGQLSSVSNLSLVNGSGQSVPVQVEVGRRWWDMPGKPIRDVHVRFVAPSVPSMAPVTYRLRDTGSNPAPPSPVSATETSNYITVDTGAAKFELKKKGGELRRAWVKSGGAYQLVIDNSSTASRCIRNRFNNDFCPATDGDAKETPFVASIVRNGPIEVEIKLESPATSIHNNRNAYYAKFPEASDPVPGYVRFYRAYSGSTSLEIDDLVVNNGIRPGYGSKAGEGNTGWPLFYKTHTAKFKTAFSNPNFKVGHNSNSSYAFNGNAASSETSSSLRASQNSRTNCVVGSTNSGYCTWAQVTDASTGLALTVSAKFMREENPNAYYYNGNDKSLTFEIAPDIGQLYMLDDMMAAYDEYTITVHDSIPSEGDTHTLYKAVRQPVIGRPSLDTIKETGTLLEYRNMVPIEQINNQGSVDRDYYSFGGQREIQDEWGLSDRLRQSNGGGIRSTGYENSLTTRFPESQKMLAFHLRDNILRPQLPPTMWATLGNGGTPNLDGDGMPVSGNPILLGGYQGSGPKVQGAGTTSPPTEGFNVSFPPGFSSEQISMRPQSSGSKYTPGKSVPAHRTTAVRTVYDPHHHWQAIPEIYFITGDPVAKYFMEAYDHIFLVYALDQYERARSGTSLGGSPRALGNMLYSMAQTYSALGTTELRQAIDYLVEAYDLGQEYVKDAYPEQNGRTHPPNGGEVGFSFQEGYQVSALAVLQEMIDPNSETARRIWRILHGEPGSGRKGVAEALGRARLPYYKVESQNAPPAGNTSTAVPGMVAAAIHTALYDNPLTGNRQPVDYINRYVVPYMRGESWDGIQGQGPYVISEEKILAGQPISGPLNVFVHFANDYIMPLADSFPEVSIGSGVGGPRLDDGGGSTGGDKVPPNPPSELQVQ